MIIKIVLLTLFVIIYFILRFKQKYNRANRFTSAIKHLLSLKKDKTYHLCEMPYYHRDSISLLLELNPIPFIIKDNSFVIKATNYRKIFRNQKSISKPVFVDEKKGYFRSNGTLNRPYKLIYHAFMDCKSLTDINCLR